MPRQRQGSVSLDRRNLHWPLLALATIRSSAGSCFLVTEVSNNRSCTLLCLLFMAMMVAINLVRMQKKEP